MTSAQITRKVLVSDPTVIPAYVPTTPFQSRSLSSTYAPTNGNTLWSDPVTSDWKSSEAGSMQNMQRAISIFSGGYSDPANRLLMAHGGGHGDGAYNGIQVFDLKGTTAPTGWSTASGSASALADVPTTNDIDHTVYLDGKAGSIHSYDGMVFDAGKLHRFNGSYWKKGTMGSNASSDWTFDHSSGLWTAKPRGFGYAVVDTCIVHNQSARKALIVPQAGDSRFYNLATESYVTTAASPSPLANHMAAVYDPTRNRAILFGTDGTRRLYMSTVDWDASTIGGWSSWTAGGDSGVFSGQAPGAFYDALLDRIWFFGSRGQTFDSIYWVDAGDFADGSVTVHEEPLSGDEPIGYENGIFFGLFKRFCFVPEWRAVAVVTTYQYPVHIIKLPSS